MNDLADALTESLGRHGPRVALVNEEEPVPRAVTYKELDAMAVALSSRFRALGVGPGQIVPIVAERTPQAVAAIVATVRLGAAFASLNPKLKGPQLSQIFHDAGARCSVVDGPGRAAVGLLGEKAPPLVSLDGAPDGVASGTAPEVEVPRGAGCVLFTSGSTGRPKGVVIAAADLARRARTEVDCFGLGPDEKVLCLLPLSFDVGMNQLFSTLLSGGALHLSSRWMRVDLARIVSRSGITGLSAVPWIWTSAMLGLPEGELVLGETPALRYVTVSAGSLKPSAFVELCGRLGSAVRVHRTYGQTETFRSAIFLGANAPEHRGRVESVGRAVPGTRVLIAKDLTALADPGELGQVLHVGDGTLLAYLGDPALTRDKLGRHPAVPGEDVVFTGDTGKLDADGYLFLQGRADGMIKTAGNRVYPREVEDALATHPMVAEAVVVGIPDVRLEERVAAAVVPRGPVTAAELRAHLTERVPAYMLPSVIWLSAELPRTASGKPALAELRQLLAGANTERGGA